MDILRIARISLSILAGLTVFQAVCSSTAGASTYSVPQAHLWADRPDAAYGVPYVANPNYQSNPGGQATVTHLAIGQYRADFPGLQGYAGNVQVAVYGARGEHCQIAGWGPRGSGLAVWVTCFGTDRFYADATFTVHFVGKLQTASDGEIGPTGAFLLSNDPTSRYSVPGNGVQWNSLGGVNTIRRRGRGRYEATLPGFAERGGSVQVTAFGSLGERCKPEQWRPRGPSMVVKVRCFDAAGAPTDARFSLRYEPPFPYADGGYVFVREGRDTSSIPDPEDQYSSSGSTNWVLRRSEGAYTVYFPDLGRSGGNAIVVAVGRDDVHCGIDFWGPFGSTQEVDVSCVDQDGAPSDSDFSLRIR